jgi:hypothetical protein
MPRNKSAKLTAQQVADTLRDCRGMIAVTARKLGVTVKAIYGYCERHAICAAARDEARAFTGDVAELKLFAAIEAGQPWAIQFYLRTQGRERGYGDHVVMQQEPVEVVAYYPDDGRGRDEGGE